jgi:TATA-binding protein-associated factor Taf7
MKKDDDATDSNESKSGDKKEGDDEEVEQKKTNELYMEVLGELEKEHSNLKKIIRLVSDSVALN